MYMYVDTVHSGHPTPDPRKKLISRLLLRYTPVDVVLVHTCIYNVHSSGRSTCAYMYIHTLASHCYACALGKGDSKRRLQKIVPGLRDIRVYNVHVHVHVYVVVVQYVLVVYKYVGLQCLFYMLFCCVYTAVWRLHVIFSL